jgi:predicted dehydrogenase
MLLMSKPRVAVIGAGSFGSNHVRVLSQMPDIDFAGVFDVNPEQARKVAREHGVSAISSFENLDAAIVATPTVTHEEVTTMLLMAGIDVLVEKPIAESSAAGERLTRFALERGRILQVGHLERFNPAVLALEKVVSVPLFFEVHRMSVFTPRSLDVDVVLDLMIHDLDIVLHLTQTMPDEIRAAGISVLSQKVDIANVRLSFASGCVANLTASRVSTERVRKLRLFQPGEYLSLDYARQDASKVAVKGLGQIGFEQLPVTAGEPLKLELDAFLSSVRERSKPKVDGEQATRALRLAEDILAKIQEHAGLVQQTLQLHASRTTFDS